MGELRRRQAMGVDVAAEMRGAPDVCDKSIHR